MKIETKIQLVDDWRKDAGVDHATVVTDDHLDNMWEFAQRNQNRYPGIREFCASFDETALAQIAKRSRMRALLEVRVAPVKDHGQVPGAAETKAVTVPRYIGTGTRSTGSRLFPLLNEDGTLSAEASSLMLAQALKAIEGHRTRYHEFLPDTVRKKLNGYVNALRLSADKAAVRVAAA